MKAASPSTHVASEVQEALVKKAMALIAKRQLLFKNMNVYSVGQLSHLIQEINEQAVMTATATTIEETDDFNANPRDNMMSMSEVRMMELPGFGIEESPSVTRIEEHKESKIRYLSSTRHDKLTITDLLEDDTPSKSYITCQSLGKEEREEQSRQIQAYRLIKQHEYEQMAKKQAQQKKKPPIFINLNNERVMFGYDSKIVKLEKIKERQNHSLSQIETALPTADSGDHSKRKHIRIVANQTPLIISNKVNITLREQQQEKDKNKKFKRNNPKTNMSVQTEIPSSIIKVNPESHKEHEEAISIRTPGIKISIQEKEFSLDKESPRGKLNRRLTRSEYLQIRSNEQIKQIFRHSNASLTNQGKVKPQERLKTEYLKEDRSQTDKTRKRKFMLTGFPQTTKKDRSKIQIHSLQGKAELLMKTKEKPSIATLDSSSNDPKKQSLSSVDRYNLLYLKYKGNPPASAEQSLISELQTQSKIHLKDKPNLLSLYTNKKSSLKRENRLIRR